MTVATGVVLRASARFNSVNAQDNVNVYWFRTSFASAQTDADTFTAVDTYISSVYADFDDRIRNGWSAVDLKLDVVEFVAGKWVVTQNVGFGSFGASLTFAGASDALPEGVSPLGFLRTGLGKHTGRKFFFGFTEADSDAGGNIAAAAVTAVVSGLTKLLTPHVISAGNDLIAVVADQAAGITRDILEVAGSGIFGYQRRRRPGVGS